MFYKETHKTLNRALYQMLNNSKYFGNYFGIISFRCSFARN